MKQLRRQPFTLIEVLIGLGLMALLIGILMGSYREIAQINQEVSSTRQAILDPLYVHKRLGETLGRAVMHPEMAGAKEFFFTSSSRDKSPSLVFTYNQGVDLDPAYCGLVLARLYVSDEGHLSLAIWPIRSIEEPAPSSFRVEVLLEDVEAWSCAFYQPPSPEDVPIDLSDIEMGREKTTPQPRWQEEWPMTHRELPAMVRLSIRLRASTEMMQEFTLTYPLVQSNKEVTFVKTKRGS